MKPKKYALLSRRQKEYHRGHPWDLNQAGLYVPYAHPAVPPPPLSWNDDVGFILNGRRIIVWWQHPRQAYAEALQARAWEEAGPGPRENWLSGPATKNYRKIGASRKKVVSYTSQGPSEEQARHYSHLRDIHLRLRETGIDMAVTPSWNTEPLAWARGVTLVAPLEVRTEADLIAVVALARSLLLRKTTLTQEFPKYAYSRLDWLQEKTLRDNAPHSGPET